MSHRFRTRQGPIPGFLLLAAGLFILAACSGDSGLPLRMKARSTLVDSLPAPVMQAFRQDYPQARILSMKLDPEDGRPFYKIECNHEGHELELLYTPEGQLVEREEEISVEAAPAQLKEAIRRKFPNNKLREVARIVRNGQVAGYKAKVKVGKMKFKIELDSAGRILKTRVK